MGKTIFDDISENNIVSGKRTVPKEPIYNENAGSSSSNEPSDNILLISAENNS